MKPKDVLCYLEKGDRTMEMLKDRKEDSRLSASDINRLFMSSPFQVAPIFRNINID
jgi:hypothetical protein